MEDSGSSGPQVGTILFFLSSFSFVLWERELEIEEGAESSETVTWQNPVALVFSELLCSLNGYLVTLFFCHI